MKKLLFLIPTLSGGGAEKVLVNLVNNMDIEKYDITVKTLFNNGENKKSLNEHIKYKFFFKKLFRGNKYFFKIFSPELLYKIIVREDYDVVISYLEGPTTRIVAGCNNNKTKLINWVHNEFHELKSLSGSYRNTNELVNTYKQYDTTVFVAETARDAFRSTLSDLDTSMKVLYNTVETENIKRKSLDKVFDVKFIKSEFNLISAGRFTHQKGFERLIQIVGRLVNEEGVDVHLYLLGKGLLEDKYKEIILNLNISNNVTLLGYKDNPYKYIRNSDLFVCSSYYEGFSTAVTESLIVGTPVVTTLCSGMRELLGENNEYGIIVENNEESLYESLMSLIGNKTEINRLMSVTKERAKKFDTFTTVREVENLIDSL